MRIKRKESKIFVFFVTLFFASFFFCLNILDNMLNCCKPTFASVFPSLIWLNIFCENWKDNAIWRIHEWNWIWRWNYGRTWRKFKFTNWIKHNLYIDEKITKLILETLHVQRKKQKPHNGNALCWFFFYVTNNKEITNKVPQIMHCTYLMSYQINDHRRSKNKIKEGSNIIF